MNRIGFNAQTASFAALVLRVGIGVLMLVHGLPKLQMLFSGDISFPGVMGMSPTISLALAVFSEVICSVLLIFGLFTRLAAIPLIITMIMAVFVFHANDPFAQQELGMLYLMAYLVVFLLGSGKFSFDAVLEERLKRVEAE